MRKKKPIKVAIIGGGCASIATAFELTRPEQKGKYHVTIYQLGWRLGGKGASGRGPADRIEEHGLHVWQGFYENAFRLLRECYAELGRDPRKYRIADWCDAFITEPFVGLAEQARSGAWQSWIGYFPPTPGLPGDPLTEQNPFSVTNYLVRTVTLLQSLLLATQTYQHPTSPERENEKDDHATFQNYTRASGLSSPEGIQTNIARLLKYGLLATAAGLIEATEILKAVFASLSPHSDNIILRLLGALAANARRQLEALTEYDEEMGRLWEVIDLILAFLRGAVRFGLATDPRGFDALNDYETREWLGLNGASERSLQSSFMRGLYDLAFAYEDGDFQRPRFAAGQGMRGVLRMFFTYRGSLFWKMRGGMGDIVFAPFYEVLKKRGVTFKFFYRLTNVRLVPLDNLVPGERSYVEALEFDIQTKIKEGREYQPLVDIRGLPCWPSQPDYDQLVDGERLEREGGDFESFWDRRKAGVITLRVGKDFDFVVLGVGIGAIPYIGRELIERDTRWRSMIDHVKTVATQSLQVWLREDLETLGWPHPQMCVAGFVHPFDTWADMRHLLSEESWPTGPRAIVYFCSAFPEAEVVEADSQAYLARCREEVRRDAIRLLTQNIKHFWPKAVRDSGEFRWELLLNPSDQGATSVATKADESRIDTQFWVANVNPSDRYVLTLPGSVKHRISPLDNTYPNLTIAGDWTSCGLTAGCVEAAMMSGRLASHAISHLPPLEDIVGYDHP